MRRILGKERSCFEAQPEKKHKEKRQIAKVTGIWSSLRHESLDARNVPWAACVRFFGPQCSASAVKRTTFDKLTEEEESRWLCYNLSACERNEIS